MAAPPDPPVSAVTESGGCAKGEAAPWAKSQSVGSPVSLLVDPRHPPFKGQGSRAELHVDYLSPPGWSRSAWLPHIHHPHTQDTAAKVSCLEQERPLWMFNLKRSKRPYDLFQFRFNICWKSELSYHKNHICYLTCCVLYKKAFNLSKYLQIWILGSRMIFIYII